jgi:DnaK suppressor protein
VLNGELTEILAFGHRAVGDLTEHKTIDADELDIAMEESSRELTLRIAEHERDRLHEIRAAIHRIHAGDYGTCTQCGGPIGFRRLHARPGATECIDCRTQSEQLAGRRGKPRPQGEQL